MSEPPQNPLKNRFRLRLVLCKAQVRKVEQGLTGLAMEVALPGGVTLKVDVPVIADVQLGDLLTLYTEVLASEKNLLPKEPPNA